MRVLARVRNIPTHSVLLNTLHVFNDGYMVSFMLLLPFIATSQHIGLEKIGILGAALNVASLAVTMFVPVIARMLGGLRALTLAALAYGVALVGIGISGNYFWLLAMFALGGICFGLFHPTAFGLIAKWTAKENRGRAIANFTAIGDVGRVGIAAAVSSLVVFLGFRATVFLYAGLILLAAAIVLVYLRKNHERIEAGAVEQKPTTPMSAWQVIKNRRLVLAISANSLDEFVSETLYIFLPFLLLARDISPALIGGFAAAYFVGNILGKTALGRLADKLGTGKVFIGAELLMALFIVLMASSTVPIVIIACSIVLGILAKGTIPVTKTMVAESVEHHGNFEKAYALDSLVGRVFKTIAPIVIGFVASAFSIVTAFMFMAGVVLLAVIPASMYFVLSRQPHTRTKQA